MEKLRELWLQRKSFTVQITAFLMSVLFLMQAEPEIVKSVMVMVFDTEITEKIFHIVSVWIPFLTLTGVIKGKHDAKYKPPLEDRG